ncbi:hypothetical protein [Hyphomicrobium sp. 99]|uniref:hypothetical protein n=1 Tax=Hyphomicrobium sp. 99 TaxID=1163419 RepID=UPI0005F7FF3A|nr:hypothetical protein [Hyphomicrobium sp. 99]
MPTKVGTQTSINKFGGWMLWVSNVPRAPDALTVVWIPACAGMTAERDEHVSENNIVIPGEPSCETRDPLVDSGPGSRLSAALRPG